MTSETSPTSSAAAGNWIRIIAVLAAVAILFGMMSGEADIEVFGLSLRPIWVGVVLYFLGFFAGLYTKRDR